MNKDRLKEFVGALDALSDDLAHQPKHKKILIAPLSPTLTF
jgi:hypothetical protein